MAGLVVFGDPVSYHINQLVRIVNDPGMLHNLA